MAEKALEEIQDPRGLQQVLTTFTYFSVLNYTIKCKLHNETAGSGCSEIAANSCTASKEGRRHDLYDLLRITF